MKDHIDILSSAHTFEEFETLKSKNDILKQVAQEIIQLHNLPNGRIVPFSEGTNSVFSYDDRLVIKIFPPFHHDQFEKERLVLKALENKLPVETPKLQFIGKIADWPYIIMSQLDGQLLEELWETMSIANKKIIIQELGALIQKAHAIPTKGLESIDCNWEKFITDQISNCKKQHEETGLAKNLISQIPDYLDAIKESITRIKTPVILTGEYTPMNFLVKKLNGVWHISGLIDFGDAMLGRPEYDLLGPIAFLIQGNKDLLITLLKAYGYSSLEITPKLSKQLTALMLLHRYSNLNVQIRIKDWKNKVSNLEQLEDLVCGFEDIPDINTELRTENFFSRN